MSAITHYSAEVAETILDRMSEGESLRSICRDETMPNRRTVLRWVDEDKEGFRARYDMAVDLRAQELADQMIEIAATQVIGEKVKIVSGQVVETTTGDTVDRCKLHVDTLKWTLARMAPKRFGDKITQEISGPDGGPIHSGISPQRMDRFCEVSKFVENLRETVPDPELRAKILEGLPDNEKEDAGNCERIAEAQVRVMAQGLEKGFNAIHNMKPPASFRGQNFED